MREGAESEHNPTELERGQGVCECEVWGAEPSKAFSSGQKEPGLRARAEWGMLDEVSALYLYRGDNPSFQ